MCLFLAFWFAFGPPGNIPKYQIHWQTLSIIYNTQIYNTADAGIHVRVLPGGHLLQMAAARPDYHTTLTWPGSQCCDSDDDDDEDDDAMIMIMFIEPGVDHTALQSEQYIFSQNNVLENFDQILITPDWDKCPTFSENLKWGLPLQMIILPIMLAICRNFFFRLIELSSLWRRPRHCWARS